MEKASLNEREQIVLQAVVHTFVTTAEPVGSRSIVKRYGLEWSAATVRNVMSDLEEYGFLQQLHTSSGRVPTNRGYRYYVDYLMRVQELTLAERRRIERELSAKLDDADEILRQTSHMLALVSHQTGLAEAPQDADVLVRSIELMPLTPSRLAVLMADNYGRVQTSMVTLANALNEAERQRVRSFLNETLRDVSIGNIQQSVQDRLSEAQDSTLWVRERALEIVKPLPGERPGQLYF
jgi:heat-inducible transcriptional repressor